MIEVLLLFSLASCIFTKTVSVYQVHEFEPNNNEALYHVTTHNTTGDIYIGAHNALYRLSEDFTIIATNSTCSSADDDCDNINKVLAIDYDHDRLITCGGGNNGRCEARSLLNLSLDGSGFVEMIVSELSAVGLIAPALNGNKMENVLYVSSGHTSLDGVNYYMYVNARRYLEITSRFEVKDGAQPDNTYKSRGQKINFKAAFSFKEYTYFAVFRQNSDEDVFFSRLSRVCHDNTFDALSEIYLRCVAGDVDYNLVQSMSVGPAGHDLAATLGLQAGEDVLYGVFAKDYGSGHSTGQSALCVYKWDEIEDAFFKALNGCLTAYGSVRVSHQLNYASGASCATNRLDLSVADVMFYMCPDDDRDLYRRYSQGIYTEAAVSQAVLAVDKTLASVTAAVEENHTIAFLGTDDGQLMKVKIVNKSSASAYENIILDAGQQIRSDTFLDKTSNYLMVLTEKKLLKLQVANCSQFTTCDECIRPNGEQDGDPYCGWCTLEKMCTRFKECKSSSWLPSNNAQCIEITDVEPPFIPHTDENIKVELTVEQLPPLNNNQSYDCKFGDFVSPGMKDGEILTCISPPAIQVPQIPTGEAAVEVSLSIHSSQTDVDFVTTQFSFFECSAIISCSECVTSFTCDWCLYGNKCTHNASAFCSADDQVIMNGNATVTPAPGGMQGHVSCPQILRQTNEVLLHVNVEKEIRIAVKNLPDASKVLSGYACVLTVEGTTSVIPASVEEATTTIVCSQYTFDYAAEDQELNANIQVVWNDNNFIDNTYKVALYKCSVLRPDCSRCLSNDTTRPELDCVWCGDQCLYDSFCSSEVNDCPAPVITQIMPPSVATVTNQPEPDYTEVIELFGTDFGQMSSDIASIMIGSKECENIADGFNINLQSVKCRAPVFSTASQRNVIISAQGKTSAPGSITYQNPSISNVSPKIGIRAGGTKVTITGMLLNTGQDLKVSMGTSECGVTNVTDTQIVCTTSPHTAEAELMVTVTFGQASRDAATFTYTANPTVADFQPKSSIKSGGRKINVTGINFQYVQEAKMLVNGVSAEKNCEVSSNKMMVCESPPVDLSSSGQRSRRQADDAVYSLTFSFDGFVPELSDEFEFAVYPDPIYYPFSNETEYRLLVEDGVYQIDTKSTSLIQLMGSGIDLASDSDVSDVKVLIGGVECIVNALTDTTVVAEVPDKEPDPVNGGDHPLVVIHHGNLEVTFGPIEYSFSRYILVITVSAVGGVLIILFIIIGVYYARRIRRFDQQTEKVSLEMELIQTQVQEEAQAAIADLTINLQELTTDDLQGIVMPFVSHRQYICNMMFSGFQKVPKSSETDTQEDDGMQTRTLHKFSELLLIKHFLLAFIRMLDNNSKVTVREKGNFASLLVVQMVIEEKMDYFTEVLEELLKDHIDDCVTSHKEKQVLIRTDSVTAKLLSNWIALSMYKYLKDYAAHPLYVLYQAIKLRIEMGAVDALSQDATFSLNLDHSLLSDITAEVVTLEVILNADNGESEKVKVLSCDTISQVKEKILDTLYRNQPYSARPKAENLDLIWRQGQGGRLALSDIDATSQRSGQWVKRNTLGDLQVTSGCTVSLAKKQEIANADFVVDVVSPVSPAGDGHFAFDNVAMNQHDEVFPSRSAGTEESGSFHYHLVKDQDKVSSDDAKKKKVFTMQRLVKREIKAIQFPRAMATKEAIQKYVNGMFEAIFWASSSQLSIPSPIKYLFDLFDEEAKKHDVDNLTLIAWKNNSLAARFWVQVITHPEFIFDIKRTTPIEVTLDIISRTFLDSCSPKKIQLTKESPINRLLYTKEIPRYRKLVDEFYEKVQASEFDQSSFVQEIQDSCHNFTGIFSRSSTLRHIFSYAEENRKMLVSHLQQDDTYESSCNLSQLRSIFEQYNAESTTRQETPDVPTRQNPYEEI